MQTLIIQSMTDPSFSTEAYSRYLESTAAYWNRVQEVVSEIINNLDDDSETLKTDYNYSSIVSAYGNLFAMRSVKPDAYIAINDNRMRVGDYIAQIVNATNKEMMWAAGDIESDDSPIDTTSTVLGTTPRDALEYLNKVACSLDVGIQYLRASILPNVSDRLASFNQSLKSKWAELNVVSSDVFSYYSDVLSAPNLTSADVLRTFTDSIGLDELASDTSTTTISDTLFYEYTGVSPIAAMDLAFNWDKPISAVKTVWKGIKRLWNGLKSTVSKVVTKVAGKVASLINATFKDPYDLYLKYDGIPVVDQFCWAGEVTFPTRTNWYTTGSGAVPITASFYSDLIGTTQTIHTIFGDFNLEGVSASNALYLSGDVTTKFSYKPMLVDVDTVLSHAGKYPSINVAFGSDTTSMVFSVNPGIPGGTDPSTLASFFSELRDDPNLYTLPADVSEVKAAQGLALSRAMFFVGMRAAFLEMQYSLTGSTPVFSGSLNSAQLRESVSYTQTSKSPANVTITNGDFVYLASGWVSMDTTTGLPQFQGESDDFSNWGDPIGAADSVFGPAFAWFGIRALMNNDQYHNPTAYSFVPYARDVANPWRSGGLAIKTDTENTAVAERVVALAAAVVGVALLGLATRRAISSIRTKAFNKHSMRANQLNAKLMAGNKLSKKEIKKLCRSKAKVGALSSLTAGSVSSSVADGLLSPKSSDDVIQRLSLLEGLITGYAVQADDDNPS